MPPITILKSELDALEQLILNQHEMIKVMKNALILLGALPADPAPITPARPVG